MATERVKLTKKQRAVMEWSACRECGAKRGELCHFVYAKGSEGRVFDVGHSSRHAAYESATELDRAVRLVQERET